MSENLSKVDKFRAIANGLADVYAKKNADYGDSFGKTWRELGIISGITRMNDKMNRIKSIGKKYAFGDMGSVQVTSEKLEDTYIDMAAYAIMSIMELEEDKAGLPI